MVFDSGSLAAAALAGLLVTAINKYLLPDWSWCVDPAKSCKSTEESMEVDDSSTPSSAASSTVDFHLTHHLIYAA